jgi:hypothetical protein
MRNRDEIHEESHARRYWVSRVEDCEQSNLITRVIDEALNEASRL